MALRKKSLPTSHGGLGSGPRPTEAPLESASPESPIRKIVCKQPRARIAVENDHNARSTPGSGESAAHSWLGLRDALGGSVADPWGNTPGGKINGRRLGKGVRDAWKMGVALQRWLRGFSLWLVWMLRRYQVKVAIDRRGYRTRKVICTAEASIDE